MLPRLLLRMPFRFQVPLGLVVAVLLGALLVTAVSARWQAAAARTEILETVNRALLLVAAQAKPMVVADDTWRVYALLKNTVAFVPGAHQGLARLAVLDAEGRVFASSEPRRLPTYGQVLPSSPSAERPAAQALQSRWVHEGPAHDLIMAEPILSEDGQTIGFTYIELEGQVFDVDWRALAEPALIGVSLALAVFVPLGWGIGSRIASPVVRIARVIGQIGSQQHAQLLAELPRHGNPEVLGIQSAVSRLLSEMQERQQAQRRALSAERMAAVGRLTAAVAHEINNPLAGLITAVDTLERHGADLPTRQRSLDLLRRGLDQIRSTVAALLPQARIEERTLRITDFDDIITLAEFAARKQQVTLHAVCTVDTALRVPAAPTRQVMLNLLLNAIKAAGPGAPVHAELQADERQMSFSVSHPGQVLSARQLADIVAHESGDDPRGFGLWVCHEIATQFGGQLSVDDSHQPGTRLVFRMPQIRLP